MSLIKLVEIEYMNECQKYESPIQCKKGKDYRVEQNPVPRVHGDISSTRNYPGIL